jgi:hypothetical protein
MSIAPFFATKTVLKFVSPIVSPDAKNGQSRDYGRGRQRLVNDFKYRKLSAPHVVRRFLQKCRFGIRNSAFYPLSSELLDSDSFRIL